jgi:hypothetical protein
MVKSLRSETENQFPPVPLARPTSTSPPPWQRPLSRRRHPSPGWTRSCRRRRSFRCPAEWAPRRPTPGYRPPPWPSVITYDKGRFHALCTAWQLCRAFCISVSLCKLPGVKRCTLFGVPRDRGKPLFPNLMRLAPGTRLGPPRTVLRSRSQVTDILVAAAADPFAPPRARSIDGAWTNVVRSFRSLAACPHGSTASPILVASQRVVRQSRSPIKRATSTYQPIIVALGRVGLLAMLAKTLDRKERCVRKNFRGRMQRDAEASRSKTGSVVYSSSSTLPVARPAEVG